MIHIYIYISMVHICIYILEFRKVLTGLQTVIVDECKNLEVIVEKKKKKKEEEEE